MNNLKDSLMACVIAWVTLGFVTYLEPKGGLDLFILYWVIIIAIKAMNK